MKTTAAPTNPIPKTPPTPWKLVTAPPVEEPFEPLPDVALALADVVFEGVAEVVAGLLDVAGVVVAGVVVAPGLLVLPSPLLSLAADVLVPLSDSVRVATPAFPHAPLKSSIAVCASSAENEAETAQSKHVSKF